MNKKEIDYYSLKSFKLLNAFFKNKKISTTKFKTKVKSLYGLRVIFFKENNSYLMKFRNFNKTIIVGMPNLSKRRTKDSYNEDYFLESDELIYAIEHEFQHRLNRKFEKSTIKNRYIATADSFDEIDEILHPVFKFSEINSISREMFLNLSEKKLLSDDINWNLIKNQTEWGKILNDFIETYDKKEFQPFYNIRKNQYIKLVNEFKNIFLNLK